MKLTFRADNDLDRDIVRGLLRRRPAIDFEVAPLPGLDDESVLLLAAQEGRILVSHDVSTIPPLFAQFRQRQRSPGVLLVPQHFPLIQSIESLELIWDLTEPDEWADRYLLPPYPGRLHLMKPPGAMRR